MGPGIQALEPLPLKDFVLELKGQKKNLPKKVFLLLNPTAFFNFL